MAFATALFPNMVITTSSSATSGAQGGLDDAYGISLISPAALTGTVTIQVEQTDTGTNFVNLQSGGVDVTIAANKGIVITPFPFRQIRLISGSTEAATRTFTLAKVFPV